MDHTMSAEQAALKSRIRKLAQEKIKPLAQKYGETDQVPQEIVEQLAKEGLFRLLFPQEYGGTGISAVNICIVREQLAQVSAIADVTFAMQALGGYPIVFAGSDEQKQEFLPKLAEGKLMTTFALTESQAGSDVAGLQCAAQEKDDYFIINGNKRFISNGFRADIGILF
ncbi:unnamed protein product, partial [marine sediment metagenome]